MYSMSAMELSLPPLHWPLSQDVLPDDFLGFAGLHEASATSTVTPA